MSLGLVCPLHPQPVPLTPCAHSREVCSPSSPQCAGPGWPRTVSTLPTPGPAPAAAGKRSLNGTGRPRGRRQGRGRWTRATQRRCRATLHPMRDPRARRGGMCGLVPHSCSGSRAPVTARADGGSPHTGDGGPQRRTRPALPADRSREWAAERGPGAGVPPPTGTERACEVGWHSCLTPGGGVPRAHTCVPPVGQAPPLLCGQDRKCPFIRNHRCRAAFWVKQNLGVPGSDR